MNLINEYNNFSDNLDQCNNLDELTNYQKATSVYVLRNEFWKQRKLYFSLEEPIAKQKSLLKLNWLQHFFGCRIPYRRNINQFIAPEGLYGIRISTKSSIGTGCTIYPNVTIGSDLLIDSPNPGFPTIGNNVYIGVGSTITGNVIIGDNVRISANSYINTDIPSNSIVTVGAPLIISNDAPPQNNVLTIEQFLEKRLSINLYEYSTNNSDSEIFISKATKDDINNILQLYRDRITWFKCKNQSQWNSYFKNHPKEEFLKKIEEHEYYIVKKGEELIAGFTLSKDSSIWGDTETNACYLRNVVSKIGYKNIGSYIVSEAQRLAQEANQEYLRLECVSSNAKLNEVWENHGFSLVRDMQDKYLFSLRELKINS